MKSLKKIGFIIFLIVNIANAQEIDKSQIIVQYKTSRIRDTLLKKVFSDDLNLLIGKSYSIYYSTKWEALAPKSKETYFDLNPAGLVRLNEGTRNVILNNYKTNQLQTLEPLGRENLTYTQPNNLLEWKIETETKTVLGYSCQKATTKYRGRNWIAWFAAEIPFTEGPWVFKGLPGLVLEVADSQNYFKFEAVAFEKKELPILFSDAGFTQTTKQEIDSKLKQFIFQMNQQTLHTLEYVNNLPPEKQYSPEVLERMRSGLYLIYIEKEEKTTKKEKKSTKS